MKQNPLKLNNRIRENRGKKTEKKTLRLKTKKHQNIIMYGQKKTGGAHHHLGFCLHQKKT